MAFIACLGAVHCMQLQPDEEHVIDMFHLLAWSATMAYKMETIGSFTTSMLSDEGSVCRFTGPGTVYVQTRNFPCSCSIHALNRCWQAIDRPTVE